MGLSLGAALPVPFFGLLGYGENNSVIKVASAIVSGLLVLSFWVTSVATIKYPIDHRIAYADSYERYRSGAQFLEDLGYEEGFAPFWIANVFTELTDGKLEIWATKDADMDNLYDKSSVMLWLQPKKHIEQLPEGKFVVVTYGRRFDEDYTVKCPLFKSESNMLYSDDYLTIYGFDDMDEYRKLLETIENQ